MDVDPVISRRGGLVSRSMRPLPNAQCIQGAVRGVMVKPLRPTMAA